MIFKYFLLKFMFLVCILFSNIGYSQFCSNIAVPPTTINGVNVTYTFTGSVITSPFSATACNLYTIPINAVGLGGVGLFTYTMIFNFPVNNLDFILVGGSSSPGPLNYEVFTFTTNVGIPSIIDEGSCYTTIANNVLTQGLGAPIMGGGYFTLQNDESFTTLTISGPGGNAGALFAICSSSIINKIDRTEEICAGDSIFMAGKFQNESGFYADTIFGGSSNGEDSIVLIHLIVNSIAIDLGNDTTLCQGDTLTLDASIPNASYLWQDNSMDSILRVFNQGTYWVQVTVDDCTASDTIFINKNSIAIDLGNDTAFCQGDTLTLDATTTNASYLWQDNSMDSILSVKNQGTYWVQITVGNCTASDTILINRRKDCEVFLEMPNIFTPNNDGINDLFLPISSKGVTFMHLKIYNRWGDKVFETNGLSVEWDGEDVSDGVYFWVIDYKDINGEENIVKGSVTILR